MIKPGGIKKSGWRSFLLAVLLMNVLAGCGGSNSKSAASPPPVVAVSVTPGSPSVSVGASQKFTATVTGTANTAVTWSVQEANGGTIDASGNYTAPMKAGSFHVVATSQADSSKSSAVGVSVTAPAPVFNTTPPTASAEGTAYSYAISATDPAGTAVTLALTTAPAGAQLSNGTIGWTPTWGQSRNGNAFLVTATSAAGGTSTQSWTLSPDGTVYGHFLLHYWGSGSDVAVPERDFSVPPLSRNPGSLLLWSQQADGTLKTIQGVGFADGTFQFPGVPAGNYIFSLEGYTTDVEGTAENTSTIYWDQDENGYPSLDPSQWWPEELVIDVNGLAPFVAAADEFDIYDRDGYWYYTGWLPDGDTVYTDLVPYILLNPPSETDRWIAVQTRGVPGTDPFTSHILGPASIQPFSAINNGTTLNNGTIVNFSAQAVITEPESVDLNVSFSSFAQAFTAAGPGASVPYSFEVLAGSEVKLLESKLSDPYIGQVTPILADALIQGVAAGGATDPWPQDGKGNDTWPADKNYGTLTYNNPFGPVEKTMYIVDAQATYSIPFPGSSDPLPWTVDINYALTSLPGGPIAPVMMPPANGNADGVAFQTGGKISSTTPTLQWDAPVGRPSGPTDVVTYQVLICEPQNAGGGGGKGGGGGGVTCVTDIVVGNVTTNSYVVPAGIMQEGHSYIFDIQAVSVRDYDAINQQRFSYPIVTSEVASAAITVAGTTTKSAASIDAKRAGGPKVGVNSAPSRMLIPSLTGSKSRSVLYRLPVDALPKVESNQQQKPGASH
jgi:hypothetical protein